MPAILIAVILLIVYGSLYPWTFQAHSHQVNPLLLLFNARSISFDRRFLADILINLALYVPVGMSGYLALRRNRAAVLRVGLPVLIGFLLSAGVEMTQLYVPGRRCSLLDLIDNTAGSVLGVIGGIFFETIAGRQWRHVDTSRQTDRSALALLLVFAGSLTFPLFPVMWLYIYRQKLGQLAAGIRVQTLSGFTDSVLVFVAAAFSWYAAGLMLRSIGAGKRWLWAFAALIPAQLFILTRQPSIAQLGGALVGITAFYERRKLNVGWIFLGVILLRGLWPLQFSGTRHGFQWIPFSGFLEMSWQSGIYILLEKAWFLGTGIWLLRRHHSLVSSVTTIAVAAAAIEVLQVWIIGRTSEITDPLLALLMGLAIKTLGTPLRAKKYSPGS